MPREDHPARPPEVRARQHTIAIPQNLQTWIRAQPILHEVSDFSLISRNGRNIYKACCQLRNLHGTMLLSKLPLPYDNNRC